MNDKADGPQRIPREKAMQFQFDRQITPDGLAVFEEAVEVVLGN